jgi:hypothetical protein
MPYAYVRRLLQIFIRPALAVAVVVLLGVPAGSVWLKAIEREIGGASNPNVAARLVADVSSAPESLYLVLFGTGLAVLGRFFARRPRNPVKRELSPPTN